MQPNCSLVFSNILLSYVCHISDGSHLTPPTFCSSCECFPCFRGVGHLAPKGHCERQVTIHRLPSCVLTNISLCCRKTEELKTLYAKSEGSCPLYKKTRLRFLMIKSLGGIFFSTSWFIYGPAICIFVYTFWKRDFFIFLCPLGAFVAISL